MAKIKEPEPVGSEDHSIFPPPPAMDWLRVGAVGAGVGLLLPYLGTVAARLTGGQLVFDLLAILLAAAAIAILALWDIYRPVLIAAASTSVLWRLQGALGNVHAHNMLMYEAFSAALSMFSYLFFYVVMRLRHFSVAAGLVVVCAVALRWLLVR